MTGVTTYDGETFIADLLFGNATGTIDTIAIGTGTTTAQRSDTALENEVYRADTANANVTVEATSERGEYTMTVQVAGGTEIDPGTAITEVGLFVSANGVMVGRETFAGLQIDSGESARIAPPFDVFP
jgi:hypothetical protein